VPLDFQYEKAAETTRVVFHQQRRQYDIEDLKDFDPSVWGLGETDYQSAKDIALKDPMFGKNGVQMSFADPEGELGGIRFKDPIKKTPGGYKKPSVEKFEDLPDPLKRKIAEK
jgi:hypothetical protein